MALNLYRRHGSHCAGGRALHDRTYEPDELRRGWRKCACPIYASGTLSGLFRRKNTESVGWAEAKATVAEWQRAASWGKPVDQPASIPPADEGPQRITVAEALNAYLAIRSSSGMAVSTLRKHRTFVKQLGQFAESRGYIMLDQFRSSDIDLFYGGLKLGALQGECARDVTRLLSILRQSRVAREESRDCGLEAAARCQARREQAPVHR